MRLALTIALTLAACADANAKDASGAAELDTAVAILDKDFDRLDEHMARHKCIGYTQLYADWLKLMYAENLVSTAWGEQIKASGRTAAFERLDKKSSALKKRIEGRPLDPCGFGQ